MTALRFRLLLSLYITLCIGQILAAYFCSSLLPPELGAVSDSEPSWFTTNLPLTFAIIAPLAVATLAGLAGMFLFKAWARTFSLYATLAGICLTPFLGASVMSWLDSTLWECAGLLWGAILALAYYSPLSNRFSAPQ